MRKREQVSEEENTVECRRENRYVRRREQVNEEEKQVSEEREQVSEEERTDE